MENQNEEGGSDSRESYGFQISDLLKVLAERKSLPCDTLHIDPRNISTTLSLLKNTGASSYTPGTFRSRAILPENISQLSACQYKRRDHLSESLMAPITAVDPSQGGQLQPNPAVLAHLLEKLKMLPSISSIREQILKLETQPHILGVQTWTKQLSYEPPRMKQFPQTGPTNEWFFEDLLDLQMKLFLGASKKSGARRDS